MGTIEHGKTSRPTVTATLVRARLHRALDQMQDARILWIAGPPGAGKTTLVGQYLATRGRPSLWCALDAADSEPATFFHYLALAAHDSAARLPAFSADRRLAPHVFAQRYFEALAALLPEGSSVVLDDFHELQPPGAVASLLATGVSMLRPSQRVLVISREPPPAELVRLLVTGALRCLDEHELLLTLDESRALAAERAPHVDDVEALHARARGWLAALLLLLDGRTTRGPVAIGTPLVLRDYLASELLDRLGAAERHTLLRLALPHQLDTRTAHALAGDDGVQLLQRLAERGSFVAQNGEDLRFELHPLLREALLERLPRELGDEHDGLLIRAAQLCAEAGDDDTAAAYLARAEDWPGLLALVQRRAQPMLGQGRHLALRAWLDRLPAPLTDEEPWALYFRAACDDIVPGGGAEGYQRAFALFGARGDRQGELLAWAGSVLAIIVQYDDMARLDAWIAEFERLVPDAEALPPPLAALVLSAQLSALNYRQLAHPRADEWVDAAIRLLERTPLDGGAGMFLAYIVESNRWWMGDEGKARVVHSLFERTQRGGSLPPLYAIYAKGVEAWFSLSTGDYAECDRVVHEGQRLAREHGIVWWDFLLASLGTYGALFREDVAAARAFMNGMTLPIAVRRLEPGQHGYLAAWANLLEGNWLAAIEHAQRGAALCAELGSWYPEALCQLVLAQAYVEHGNPEGAERAAARAETITAGSNTTSAHAALVRAQLALDAGDADRATQLLTSTFARARQHGASIVSTFSAKNDVIARLCALALENEIEPDIVNTLLACRPPRLFTPDPTLERWPWRARVLVLGRFTVEIDGTPLPASGKAPARSLELLQRLIVAGSAGSTEAHLLDTLWPDAEGDRAERALTTALHRLRALLGDSSLVRRQAGVVSLDGARLFVDAWAVELLLERKQHTRARALYRGPLLAVGRQGVDDWPAAAREKLARRLRHAGT